MSCLIQWSKSHPIILCLPLGFEYVVIQRMSQYSGGEVPLLPNFSSLVVVQLERDSGSDSSGVYSAEEVVEHYYKI